MFSTPYLSCSHLVYFGRLIWAWGRGNLIISCSTYCKHCSSLRNMPFQEHCRLLLRRIVKFVFGSGLDNGLYILVKKQRLKCNFRLIPMTTNCVFVTKFVQNTARNTLGGIKAWVKNCYDNWDDF